MAKRLSALAATLLVGLAFAAAAVADDDDPGDYDAPRRPTRLTFVLTTPDDGCHGQRWATDVVRRTYTVRANRDGTYRLTRTDSGTFTTLRGRSPGACARNRTRHGSFVAGGIKGKMSGTLAGIVRGGTFDPSARCTSPCLTDVFVTVFFGGRASFTCFESSTDCRFRFAYTAARRRGGARLRFRSFRYSGTGAGSRVREVVRGDIATR